MSCLVKLRGLKDEDAPMLYDTLRRPEVSDWLDEMPVPYTIEDAKAFIFFAQGKASSGRDFAIDAGGDFAGVICIKYGSGMRFRTAEIGYYVHPSHQNKRVATKAIRLICQFGFEKRNLLRICAHVPATNAPSRRALEKAGGELESIQKNAAFSIKDGEVLNMAVYTFTSLAQLTDI